MGDANPIRTFGDYSKPSHKGYRNTIELPEGNNVVPLRSDTIRLEQKGCSFHGLQSEDPNQHLKDFLKLVDSLDLDGENRERTHQRLFQFSLRNQASNWLECLPAGSITTWGILLLVSLLNSFHQTIFHLPQANANNHDNFVPPPSFLDMGDTKAPSDANSAWMISEEMKNTEHYRMYAEVFGLDVPLTQPQLTESTQGKHRTPSTPRRSTCLTPQAPVPTVDKVDEMILQDTLQVSLAEHKSPEEQEARENVELVNKHLASEEIEKMMEGSENVIDDSLLPRNDEPNIPGTRLEPRSDKESLEVEITNDEEMKFEGLQVPQTTCRTFVVHPKDQDDPHDDAHPEGENHAKRQKTFEYEAYVYGESSSGQDNENEQGPSTSGNQEQEDDYDF
ncbi:hypothetical protein Tco_0825009 [Tanacetum coccineum]